MRRICRSVVLSIVISLFVVPGLYGQLPLIADIKDGLTVLSAGDIGTVTYHPDDQRKFSFAILRDLKAGTVINFSDTRWLSSAGTVMYTVPSDLTAGTVIASHTSEGGPTVGFSGVVDLDPKTVPGSNDINFGGQAIAFRDAETSPTVPSVQDLGDGNTTLAADITSQDNSDLSADLNPGNTASSGSDDAAMSRGRPESILVGELIYATNGSSITRFEAGSLGTTTTVALTGLQAGETLVGIDLRPSKGAVYGIGSTSRVYTIAPLTGAATQVGAAGAFTLNGTAFGTDFNPTADRIREVSNTEQSLRLNPNDGTLAGTDTALNPAGNIVAVAYDRNDNDAGTPTTLFGIDSTAGTLVIIGSINGTPNSPNAGQITTIGTMGLGTNLNDAIGFDISGNTGVAFATITTGGISKLYTINLVTGAATLVGTIGSGTTPFLGMTVALPPTASEVALSGSILTSDGRGITNATVTVSGGSLGSPVTVVTGRAGAYTVTGLQAGDTYVITVSTRRFMLTEPTRVITLTDSATGVDFSASP